MPPAPVKIERIAGDRSRQNTFHKRKLGLIKKAIELTVLCDCDVTIIMKSGPTMMCPEGKMSAYCNTDLDAMIAEYMTQPPQEHYTNAEYPRLAKTNELPQQYVPPMFATPMMQNLPAQPAVQVKVEPTAQTNSEEAQPLQQRLASMEEELDRLRAKVNSGSSAAENDESKVGRKRSPPPLEEISHNEEPRKRVCIGAEAEQGLIAAETADAEESSVTDLLESMEQPTSVAPEALTLKAETSTSLASLALRIGGEVWGSRVGREASWDLSSILALTPTHALAQSPCNRLAAPSLELAGLPLLARA